MFYGQAGGKVNKAAKDAQLSSPEMMLTFCGEEMLCERELLSRVFGYEYPKQLLLEAVINKIFGAI